MMVPNTRLITATGLVTLLLAGLVVARPESLTLAAAGLVLFSVLALLDFFLGYEFFNDLKIEIPEALYLSKDQPGEIKIQVQKENHPSRKLKVGLALPPEVRSLVTELCVELKEAGRATTLSWPIRAEQRGIYTLDTCFLEVPSPLGFWALRRRRPIRLTIHVYPALQKERKTLAALFMRKAMGVHLQRQIGKGREFEQLREYQSGDSFDDIHWKATAKRGKPITKVYQIERTQELYLLIDASRLSARSSLFGSETENREKTPEAGAPIIERFVTAALVLGMTAKRQGDLFGMLTFSNRVQSFLKAQNNAVHYDACRKLLYLMQAQAVAPDFDEVFTFIRNRIRRRALLIFLTNLDDPVLAEGFIKNIDLIGRHHLILVNMLRPGIARPLFSNPEVEKADDLYRELGGHLLWSQLRETAKILQRHGVRFNLLENENLCVELIAQYLSVKQRQLL
ncbi:MAG: DUF58 domain-containing protein [Desulfobacteraceae bacterium]|nr:MAG: DUF58 domain-containing protein [Desulfobacteraceae bacterium]